MTTSPPRWIIPKIGGFSFASVPRPGAPFSRRRRPGRPFFRRPRDGPCARPRRRPRRTRPRPEPHRGLPGDDPLAQLRGHHLGVVLVEVQFLGDLLVGEVQAHEVQAQDPDPQRLVVAGEDGVGQVVEAAAAAVALVALPLRLGVVPPVLVTSAESHAGQRTPSGQRSCRTVSKHLASSMRDEEVHQVVGAWAAPRLCAEDAYPNRLSAPLVTPHAATRHTRIPRRAPRRGYCWRSRLKRWRGRRSGRCGWRRAGRPGTRPRAARG